jgi:hypothetical protein
LFKTADRVAAYRLVSSQAKDRRMMQAFDLSTTFIHLRDGGDAEPVKVDSEAGIRPTLVLLEGVDLAGLPREDLLDLRALAQELAAEVWLSVSLAGEQVTGLPEAIRHLDDTLSVVLALEPAKANQEIIVLRALKDHDNPDVSELHVALDPKTLRLIRNLLQRSLSPETCVGMGGAAWPTVPRARTLAQERRSRARRLLGVASSCRRARPSVP